MPQKFRAEAIELKLGLDSSDRALSIAGRTYANSKDGTRLLVTGALHGDEPTAIGAIWYFEEAVRRQGLNGTVTVIPCVNPLAAGLSSRLVPLEGSDVNRSFPGRVDGSLAERTAAALTKLLADHDALVDVHTAGWCVPFALLDTTEDNDLSSRIARWARVAGLPVVREMEARNAQLQGLERSWSAWAVAQGKPAFTLELTGFHTLDHEGAILGGEALLKLAKAKDSLGSRRSRSGNGKPRPHNRRTEVFAGASGLFEAVCRPGQRIRSKHQLGWIKSLTGSVVEKVVAPSAGMVLALQPVSSVHIGSWIATIATSSSRIR